MEKNFHVHFQMSRTRLRRKITHWTFLWFWTKHYESIIKTFRFCIFSQLPTVLSIDCLVSLWAQFKLLWSLGPPPTFEDWMSRKFTKKKRNNFQFSGQDNSFDTLISNMFIDCRYRRLKSHVRFQWYDEKISWKTHVIP